MVELQIAGDLDPYRGKILAYAYLPGLFCLTIIVQVLKRRFDGHPAFYGAFGYWWLNGVTAAVAVAVSVATARL